MTFLSSSSGFASTYYASIYGWAACSCGHFVCQDFFGAGGLECMNWIEPIWKDPDRVFISIYAPHYHYDQLTFRTVLDDGNSTLVFDWFKWPFEFFKRVAPKESFDTTGTRFDQLLGYSLYCGTRACGAGVVLIGWAKRLSYLVMQLTSLYHCLVG